MTNTPRPIPTPTPNLVLFADDFKNGINPSWRQIEGEWIAANGQLTILSSNSQSGVIEVGDNSWDNYSVDFDTGDYQHNWINGIDNTLFLFVRVKDKDNAPFFTFTSPSLVCGIRRDGADKLIQPIARGIDGSYHVHVEMKGQSYTMSVRGETVCSFSDNNAFANGGVRVQFRYGTNRWPFIRNFVVKRIPSQ